MYTKTILASAAALMASTAMAGSPGSAIIVNACTYPVFLSAVPSANGGYSSIDKTLQPKETWSQQWTELSNGNGWSLKLSKTQQLSNILQYEYTYHNDGIIWYDLSCVDGNPWDGNWEVTASGLSTCLPKQSFYRFATDDAYGMQSCGSDASITVTLCSGEDQAESVVSAVVAATSALPVISVPAVVATTPSPVATTTSTPAPAPVPTTTSTASPAHTEAPAETGHHYLGFGNNHFFNANEAVTPTATAAAVTTAVPTTFATAVITAAAVPADSEDDEVVTVVETIYETAYAYETYVPGKRHVHHPNHPHFR